MINFAFWYHNSSCTFSNSISVACCAQKASKELNQNNVSAQDKDYFDVTLGYFLHCNFVDAGNGLMSHYPVEKIEAKHLVGKCQESMVRVFIFSQVGEDML